MPDGEQQLVVKSKSVFLSMMRYAGELLVALLLVFSSYASLQKGALKIQLQPPPVPFFGTNSTVRDFYGGDVATPFSTVINSDVSLVMYYTPWDFDSQLTKVEFDKIAYKYQDQVYSTAINCWVNNGACRKTFPKLRTFPLILGYVEGRKGVHYRGPLQYQYLDKFVQHLLKPLERIEVLNDFYRLMAKSSAVVTGYFNFNQTKPVGFHTFYVAALRYLEYDVHKSVQFAVITNPKAASRMGINLFSVFPMRQQQQFDVRLHLWNETLIYPHNGSAIDVGRFLHWVYYRSHSPIQWIWPSVRKSQVIQHYLLEQQRPSLILFTPKLEDSPQTMLAKEVALDYNNCGPSPRISRLIREIQGQRELVETARLDFEKKCAVFEGDPHCRSRSNITISDVLPGSYYLGSEETCWPSIRPSTWRNSIQGLGCRTNRSLNFFLVDSDQYPEFIRNLGYSTYRLKHSQNFAVIIDPKDESHFVLDHSLTRDNLEEMIINYAKGRLRRFRRSHSVPYNCPAGRICVQDISANQFESVVLDPSHDVVVFYRKSGCVFCEVGTRAFLKLSQMFSLSGNIGGKAARLRPIKFVTIDAEANDLPWQFTVERYPSVIFYPAFRKMDSRVFPQNLELNAVNLLNFTLFQLSPVKRIMWFVHFCQDADCLREAQRHINQRLVFIEQHIRILRHRLLWSDEEGHMERLRDWLKQRRFYRELSYAVLNSLSEKMYQRNNDRFPDGIRLAENE